MFARLQSVGDLATIELDAEANPHPIIIVDDAPDSDGDNTTMTSTEMTILGTSIVPALRNGHSEDSVGNEEAFEQEEEDNYLFSGSDTAHSSYRGRQKHSISLATDMHVKAESVGKLAVGESPLPWAVLRPVTTDSAASSSKVHSSVGKRKSNQNLHDASSRVDSQERAANRLQPLARSVRAKADLSIPADGNRRMSSTKTSKGNSSNPDVAAAMSVRATTLLSQILSGGPQSQAIAAAIVKVFLEAHGPVAARRLLLDLGAALRRNATLREEVLASGVSVGAKLLRQDPREWATEELLAKRCRWAEEALQKILPAGPIGVCPCCDGRAVVAAGTAGSGRAGRTTKAFYHYTCIEVGCGKSSHLKQD